MPLTTEPCSGNFFDETVLWIVAAEQEREAMRTHTSPRARHGRSSNTQFRARGFGESTQHPLIRIVSLHTGYRRLRRLPTATRLAVRVLSASTRRSTSTCDNFWMQPLMWNLDDW